MEPLHDFYKEFNKDAQSPVFAVVMVSCDKNEEEFQNHLKEMPWVLAMPF